MKTIGNTTGVKGIITGYSSGKASDSQIGASVNAGDQNKQGKVFTEIFGICAGKASSI